MKLNFSRETIGRTLLMLVVLFSGVAMVPYIDMPKTALTWELFAGIYTPNLTSPETQGGPGSFFEFNGTNYPPNSSAMVYVNGRSVGSLTTDATGSGSFLIGTSCALPGTYNVTMEVNINASATQTYQLIAGNPAVPPPGGFVGPTFAAGTCSFLPIVAQP